MTEIKDPKTGLTQHQAEELHERFLSEPEQFLAEREELLKVAEIEENKEKTPEELEYDDKFHKCLIKKLKEVGKIADEEEVIVGQNGEKGIHYVFAEMTDDEYDGILKLVVEEIGEFKDVQTYSSTTTPEWEAPNGVKYHGSLPQLFKVDGTSSSFVLPVYKSIFDDKADTAKLTNRESFTIIIGPTGTTTNGGKKVNRHKISLCAPGGGMIERFLDQYTDTASGKLIPWTNKRIGVVQFINTWRCSYKVYYSTNGGLPIYNGSANQIGVRAPHGKRVLAQNGASVGSTYRNWIRIVGYESSASGNVSGFIPPAGDWNVANAWFVSTGIESQPTTGFVRGNW